MNGKESLFFVLAVHCDMLGPIVSMINLSFKIRAGINLCIWLLCGSFRSVTHVG